MPFQKEDGVMEWPETLSRNREALESFTSLLIKAPAL
jgi:hypothetical protein